MSRLYEYHEKDKPCAPINYYYDNLVMASKLGYNSYSEAVAGLYEKYSSMRKVADVFGVTDCSILRMLRKLGIRRNETGGIYGAKRARMVKKECKKHGITDFYEKTPGICVECQREYNRLRYIRKDLPKPVEKEYVPKQTYQYHPKDRAYIKKNGMSHITYYTDRIEKCRQAGYDSWVDALCHVYKETKSMRITAQILGVTSRCVGTHLHRLESELEALGATIRAMGGINHAGAYKFDGAVCPRCNTTKKYKSSRQCVECVRRYNGKLRKKRLAKKTGGQNV